MAKIDRYNGNLAAFASQADTNRRTTFGTEITGDDTLDGNLTPAYFTGWQIVGPNEFPTLEDFNAAFFTIGRLMAYVHQVGMPEWNGSQEYHTNSMTNRNGAIYVCLTDNHVSATPPESDSANWFNATQAGQNIAVFDTAGVTNWTVPAVLQNGLRKAHVTVTAGGARGGHADNVGGRGAGGGAGGTAIKRLDLSGVSSITVTVGGSGESSSFGSYLSATTGTAGGDYDTGAGGRGGVGSGGDINLEGGYGSDGTSSGMGSGDGGGSYWGGGQRSGTSSGSPSEPHGAAGGGGGGTTQTPRGDGIPGIITIEW